MKATVNDSCIGCGLCEGICPEVFRLGDSGKADAYAEVTTDLESTATEARDACPVSAISLED